MEWWNAGILVFNKDISHFNFIWETAPDNILDLYNKINDYCNPSYVNIHNNPNFPEFFNIIYKRCIFGFLHDSWDV